MLALSAAVSGAVAKDPPTTESWAKAANAVCASANAKVRRPPAPTSNEELVADLRAIARLSADEYGKLAAIARPPSSRLSVARLLTILRTQNRIFSSRLIPALRQNDSVAATNLIQRNDRLSTEFNGIARRLGAPACASSPQPSG
jgi:hypothetical protein